MKCSIFKSLYDPNTPYHRDISVILERIRSGASKDLVLQYRKTKSDNDKKKLPGYCFNGTFNNRSENGLIEMSGLIIVDFDKFSTEQDAIYFKEALKKSEFTYCAFISPSGLGVKCLVKIPKEIELFKLLFNGLEKYYNSSNFDRSGKDISRFCFESYDSDIYINENSTEFTYIEQEEVENIGKSNDTVIVPLQSENQIIQNILKWFNEKYPFVEGERNNSLFKLAMALNDFGINQMTTESLLSEYQHNGFPISEINQIIKSAYKRGTSSFGTKTFEDLQLKKNIELQIRKGKPTKEIVSQLSKDNITIIEPERVIEKIKENLEVSEFWTYSEKGAIKLSPHKFKFWLEQNNFMKYYPADGNTYTYIRKEQNFIEETNEKKIKDFVLETLLSDSTKGFKPYDYMAGNPQFFTPNYLSFLKSAEITIKEDTANECYLYYHNCALKITKNTREIIDYLSIDAYVWKNQIIQRDYIHADHHESIFRTFIWKISGEDVQRYNTFKSVIGYLLHSFKTSANNKAVILNDETISENPNGGSGKGVFWNAISKMKKVSMIDGKTFEFTKSFPYQTVSTDCQVLVFDDVKKNFTFESLFSLITEGITLEYKGQDAIKLPIQKSPKILITTNYTVGGVGGSFDRRKFEVELSGYFSANYTPLDEFGHLLFDEWDDDEWARFDNYMINCLHYYLEFGLVQNQFHNLRVRKFIKETSFEFYLWSIEENQLTHNDRLYKGSVFENFINEYPDYKKWLSQKKFKKWLEQYAEYKEMEYVEGNSIHGRWFEINDK